MKRKMKRKMKRRMKRERREHGKMEKESKRGFRRKK
jgi:hypothetical protein